VKRPSALGLALLLGFSVPLAGSEPSDAAPHDRAGSSAEVTLVQALEGIEKGRFDLALRSLADLIALEPRFRLARLVYADLLSARTEALEGFGHRGSRKPVDDLLTEARARWQHYAEPPPPALAPRQLLQIPSSAERILLVDLEAYRLYIMTVDAAGRPSALGDYYVSIGKGGSDKRIEGDEKTPVGVYSVVSYFPGNTLPDLYGRGAFPINYPNSWDKAQGRTGSGIWIHGTQWDSFSRPPLSSRGCVTLSNADFAVLEKSIDVGETLVVVSDHVDWVDSAQVKRRAEELSEVVERWRRDWESRDADRYLSHYSKSFRSQGMDYAAFSRYKRRVNGSKRYIRVGISDLALLEYPGEEDLVLAQFSQTYESHNFNAKARKQQYWRREGSSWKIVLEANR